MMLSVMLNSCAFDYLKSVDICQMCQTSGLASVFVGIQRDVTLLVLRRARWSTHGSEEVKGLCTFKLIREAYFNLNFELGFRTFKWAISCVFLDSRLKIQKTLRNPLIFSFAIVFCAF